jgi:hypothetical protein
MTTDLAQVQELVAKQASRPARDLWEWLVEYRDGTLIYEYDENGEARGFSSVNLSQVASIVLVPRYDGLPHHGLKIDTSNGKRPIFFRRRKREVSAAFEDLGEIGTIHVIGWQDTSKGKNTASYTFIMPNGNVLVSDDREAIP